MGHRRAAVALLVTVLEKVATAVHRARAADGRPLRLAGRAALPAWTVTGLGWSLGLVARGLPCRAARSPLPDMALARLWIRAALVAHATSVAALPMGVMGHRAAEQVTAGKVAQVSSSLN